MEFFLLGDVDENKKTTWVSYCLGVEGKRQAKHILSKITTDTKHVELLKELSQIFYRKQSKLVARNIFGRRMMRQHESAMEFLSALQALTVDCEFKPDVADESVIDRYIIGLTGEFSELRGKLLGCDSLTLDKVKSMVSEFVTNKEQTVALDAASKFPEYSAFAVNNALDRVDTAGNLSWRRGSAPSMMRGPPFTNRARGRGSTFGCGYCGRANHTTAVCFKRQNDESRNPSQYPQARGRVGSRPYRGNPPNRTATVHRIDQDGFDDEEIGNGEFFGDYEASGATHMVRSLAVESRTREGGKMYLEVEFRNFESQMTNNEKICKVLVDTGSDYTLIPINIAETLGLQMKPSNLKLGGYTGHEIRVLGETESIVAYNGREWPCKIVVVKDGPPLLGLNEILGLQVDILRVQPVLAGHKPVTDNTMDAPQHGMEANHVKGNDCPSRQRRTDDGLTAAAGTGSRKPGGSRSDKNDSCQESEKNMKLPDVAMDDVCRPSDKVFQGVGRAIGFFHTIRLKNGAVPRIHKPRPVPLAMAEKHAENLEKLEKLGIISPVKCPAWLSPFTCVWKKGTDKVRSTLDLRYLNSQIVEQRYPLPSIENFLQRFHGMNLFSTADLSMAYHQLPLAEESRELTSFMTPKGPRMYNFVPFGLSSGGAACEEFLEETLEPVQIKYKSVAVIAPYMDDIVMATKGGVKIHKLVVHDVLTAVFEAGLTLSYEKCKWGRREVVFLGHVISADGVAPGPANVKAILEAGTPEDQRQLISYLGLAGFFARFVYGWSAIVAPMYDVAKEPKWRWTDEAECAFQNSKQAIANTTIDRLKFFKPGGDTTLICDASGSQICAILCQADEDGAQQPISFFSRRLKGRELNFSVGEKELIAVIEGCERNHHLVYGRKFKIKTDHRSLVSLLEPSSVLRVTQRMARWSARLLRYDFQIVYIPTDENPADALTRLPINSQELADRMDVDADDDIVVLIAVTDELPTHDEQAELRRCIIGGWPGDKNMVVDMDARATRQLERELWVDKENKVRRGEEGIWVAPRSARSKILELAHQGHPGRSRMKNLVRQWAWWPGMVIDVDKHCTDCTDCALADKTHKSRDAHGLNPIPLPGRAWDVLSMDVVGPMSFSPRYVVTLIDNYSRWPEVTMGDIPPTTQNIIKFLNEIFGRFGFPSVLKTDGASVFVSEKFNEYLARNNVKHHKTTGYNSRSNATVERFNGVINDAIIRARKTNRDVRCSIFDVVASYRRTPHSVTGSSPALLLLGREVRGVLEAFTGAALDRKVPSAADVLKRTCQRRGDEYGHDTGARYKVGDYVMVKKPRAVAKGESKYEGPARIVRMEGTVTAALDNGWIVNTRRLSPVKSGTAVKIRASTTAGPTSHPNEHYHKPCADGREVEWNPGTIGDDAVSGGEDDARAMDLPVIHVRRSGRQRHAPQRFADYDCGSSDTE